MSSLYRGLVLSAAVVAALVVVAPATAQSPRTTEVVVALEAPPLARAVARSRALSTAAKQGRLSLVAPFSRGYLSNLAAAQSEVAARIERAVPPARIRWRYSVVLNGLAVVVPRASVNRLATIRGVARVYPSVRYRARLNESPQLIRAPQLWGADLSTAGNGIKIGIVDDGIDQRHSFFAPAGFAAPEGYPRGNTAFTTAKVIVARAFPPPSPGWRHAAAPFDPEHSVHGTHVAGIAAGNPVRVSGTDLSGVAPRAYLGNYKVLTIPTASNVGLDGNSPEIAAGIEAAVRDGMDVINLSLGEPEIEPGRDLVVQAINAAADAGVVPAVAAGNDYDAFGRGSLSSPGSAAKAITTAAVTKTGTIADFSSSGPTPISLQLKPDVAAPGVRIASSVPARYGSWESFSGTSMAAPHVAGGAALLRQRYPTWTVAQLKSALVLTGQDVRGPGGVAPTTRAGGGLIDLERANNPLVFADPATVSFGLIRRGASVSRTVQLGDAGGGSGSWAVAVEAQSRAGLVSAPTVATVPGTLELTASAAAGTAEGEATGFVVLTRGTERRRIPYWLRVTAPRLASHRRSVLRRTGVYRGNTRGRPALVDVYRYPDDPQGAGVTAELAGPEQVFRVTLTRPVANFGVAILGQTSGADVEARIVVAGDENRQVGYTSLPINLNPYLRSFLRPVRVAGAVLAARGSYDIVFDSETTSTAGRFTFRFWIGDTKPPSVRLLSPRPRRGQPVRVRVSDAASGVWPASLETTVDGRRVEGRYRRGVVAIPTRALRRGRHALVLQVSDHQETRNMENVYRILPNTARRRFVFSVR